MGCRTMAYRCKVKSQFLHRNGPNTYRGRLDQWHAPALVNAGGYNTTSSNNSGSRASNMCNLSARHPPGCHGTQRPIRLASLQPSNSSPLRHAARVPPSRANVPQLQTTMDTRRPTQIGTTRANKRSSMGGTWNPHDTKNLHTQPPPAPDQPILLCWPRLALINHHHPELDTSWRELPTGHMEWALTLDRTSNEWQPEWVSLRCNTAVTPNDLSMDINVPPPICPFHGPRRLAIDVRHNERGWVCSRGLPPHILECEPTRINPAASPSTPAAPGQRQWEHQRPPRDGQAIPHANSWFYVPLLLAGANHLITPSSSWRVAGSPACRARMAKPGDTTPGSTSNTMAAFAPHPPDASANCRLYRPPAPGSRNSPRGTPCHRSVPWTKRSTDSFPLGNEHLHSKFWLARHRTRSSPPKLSRGTARLPCSQYGRALAPTH